MKKSIFLLLLLCVTANLFAQVVVSPAFHAVQYHHEFKCGDNVTFIYNGSEVTYGTVESQGRCWLDRNLGANQVATSSTDHLAYGDLFQWGRLDDGHQIRTSGTTSTLSNSDDPGHGNFITNNNSPYDWCLPQNANLWQGISGTNNPCPSGYRLPTEAEWEAERTSWSSNNAAGAFASPLKLPVAGYRHIDGLIYGVSFGGYYYSSSVNGTYSKFFYFDDTPNSEVMVAHRTYGNSVRCIKELPLDSYLKAYYPFNGNSNDESGNDYHLSVTNAVLCNDRNGNPQSAYNFNGTNAYLQLNTSFVNTKEFTITAWINPSELINFQHTILSERNPAQNYQLAIVLGKLYFSIWTSCGELSFTGSNVNTNEWQFIAVTYKNFNVKLYQNGIVDQSFYLNSTCVFNAQNSNMHIGVNSPFGNYFKGCIDDIKCFSKALDEEEVLLIYNE